MGRAQCASSQQVSPGILKMAPRKIVSPLMFLHSWLLTRTYRKWFSSEKCNWPDLGYWIWYQFLPPCCFPSCRANTQTKHQMRLESRVEMQNRYGGMAQRFRALVLPRDLGSVPSTHIVAVNHSNSSSIGSDTVFWPLQTTDITCMQTPKTYDIIIFKKKKWGAGKMASELGALAAFSIQIGFQHPHWMAYNHL